MLLLMRKNYFHKGEKIGLIRVIKLFYNFWKLYNLHFKITYKILSVKQKKKEKKSFCFVSFSLLCCLIGGKEIACDKKFFPK